MNRFVLLILAASATSFADDPFACVDPDIADAFLGGWYQNSPTYSTSVPGDFVELNIPTSLTLVGSQVADSHMMAVYKTEESTEAALSAAVSAMTEAGWTAISDQQMPTMRGFQSSLQPRAISLCSDDKSDALSVMVNGKSGQTYVSYSMYGHMQSRICSEQVPTAPMAPHGTLMGHLPILKLPENAKSFNGGGGGSGDEANTRVDVLTAMSQSELLSFIGDQVRDQQWEFDTNWSGRMSSGSLWTLDTPDDGILIGMLHIFGPSVGAVRVRFSVSSAEPQVGIIGQTYFSN